MAATPSSGSVLVAPFALYLRAFRVQSRASVCSFGLLALAAQAQQPIGTVLTRNARISGTVEVTSDRATLLSNASVTALDDNAAIALTRGGEALVCSGSQFHILHSGQGKGLLFNLDRGAFQVLSPADPQDIVLTPDIRFTLATQGDLDLRIRVTNGGDTCVDNHGVHAPVLALTNSFGGATYRLLPNQHVLFERGDLHTVVDNERSSCGCPPANASAGQRAALEHPFPEAQSSGLVPEAVPTPSDTVTLSAGGSTKKHRGFFASIGHFFRRILGS